MEQPVSQNSDPNEPLARVLAGVDLDALRAEYESNGRLLFIDDFLPEDILQPALEDLEKLRGAVHRNYVPGQKKGGSVSRHSIDRTGELIGNLYRSPALREFLEKISGARLLDCLPSDPHTYALYLYTEPGDHIGWHYDTSFYRGERFTLLLGLIENESSRLECEINTRDDSRPTESRVYRMKPGSLAFFDGDRLWHRVTKMAEADHERVVITMEFVTDSTMHPWRRFVSNVKDAFAYFGVREVFARRPIS